MVFNNLEEIEKYYNEETNTYIFKENDEWIELVELKFNLEIASAINARDIKARDINASAINACDINAWDINASAINAWDIKARDINARDINARDINASDINARDINARDINAGDISFYACCISYQNIICKKIEGRRDNSKYLALDGEVVIKEKKNND